MSEPSIQEDADLFNPKYGEPGHHLSELEQKPQPGSINYAIEQAERDDKGNLRWLKKYGAR